MQKSSELKFCCSFAADPLPRKIKKLQHVKLAALTFRSEHKTYQRVSWKGENSRFLLTLIGGALVVQSPGHPNIYSEGT